MVVQCRKMSCELRICSERWCCNQWTVGNYIIGRLLLQIHQPRGSGGCHMAVYVEVSHVVARKGRLDVVMCVWCVLSYIKYGIPK